jgi:hypothetical protein
VQAGITLLCYAGIAVGTESVWLPLVLLLMLQLGGYNVGINATAVTFFCVHAVQVTDLVDTDTNDVHTRERRQQSTVLLFNCWSSLSKLSAVYSDSRPSTDVMKRWSVQNNGYI